MILFNQIDPSKPGTKRHPQDTDQLVTGRAISSLGPSLIASK